jgi:hypothetical protein
MDNRRKKEERRSRTLIKKNFQKKFLKLIVGTLAVLTVIIMGVFYIFLRMKINSAGFSAYTEERLAELIGWLYWAVPLVTLIFIAIAVIWSIHISARVAGPLYALEKQLHMLLEGKIDQVQLRNEDDEMIPLANLINSLIVKKNKDIEAEKENG